jgi:hypothetical protein
MSRKVLVIKPQGEVSIEKLGPEEGDYTFFSEAVGGYFQRVPLGNYTQNMWVNEEGKLIGLPHNPLAQKLWDKEHGRGTDYVVGTVVITGDDTDEGTVKGLSEEEVENLVSDLAL